MALEGKEMATKEQHEREVFADCRRVIHEDTVDPDRRQERFGGKRLPEWYDDLRRELRGAYRVGCGGRMDWRPAEPRWLKVVGYVGICTHCGWQVFTGDLLENARKSGRLTGVRRAA